MTLMTKKKGRKEKKLGGKKRGKQKKPDQLKAFKESGSCGPDRKIVDKWGGA